MYQEAYNKLYSKVVEAALFLHNTPLRNNQTEMAETMLVDALKTGEQVFKERLFEKISLEKPPPTSRTENSVAEPDDFSSPA